METIKKQSSGTDLAERLGQESWTYINTVINTAADPFLILDKDLCVGAANKAFYKFFQVAAKDTEHNYVRDLGNGEWNIPALEVLLKGIVPNNTFFGGFEVDKEFPSIGRKVMLLNGRRIYKEGETAAHFPPIILLAMVDITQMTIIAAELADHVAQIEGKLNERTEKLETDVTQLKKDFGDLKTGSQGRSSK